MLNMTMAAGNFTPSQQVITNNLDTLIDSVDVDDLYPYLVEHDMLTQRLGEELRSDKTQREKKQLLFSTLTNQRDALPTLIQCLRQSAADHTRLAHHGRLADNLERQQIEVEKTVQNQEYIVDYVGGQVVDIAVGHNEDEPLLNENQRGPRAPNGTTGGPGGAGGPGAAIGRDGAAAHYQGYQRPEPGRNKKKALKQSCIPASICYVFAVILCIMCSVPTYVVTWRLWAQTSTYKMSVSYNQTVQLPIRSHVDDRFTYSLFLQLVLPGCSKSSGACTYCVCQVLVLPCSNLSSFETHTQDVSESSRFFYNSNGLFYLLNRSTISITYSVMGKPDVDTPASVWIFWNQSVADKANSPQHYPECSDANHVFTEYGMCMSLKNKETFVYSVTQDQFYFIRCFKDGADCFNNVNWTMDVYSYDYSRHVNLTNENVPITMYNISTVKNAQVTLRDRKIDLLHYGSSNPDYVKCILIHKPATSECELSDSTSYVYMSDVTQVYDSWVISAFPLFVVMVIIISVAIFVHVRCYLSKAKKPGAV